MLRHSVIVSPERDQDQDGSAPAWLECVVSRFCAGKVSTNPGDLEITFIKAGNSEKKK